MEITYRHPWSPEADRHLQQFIVTHQNAVHSYEELVHLAARYFGRSTAGIRDRIWCLRYPYRQRKSRVYPWIGLRGTFTTGFAKANHVY